MAAAAVVNTTSFTSPPGPAVDVNVNVNTEEGGHQVQHSRSSSTSIPDMSQTNGTSTPATTFSTGSTVVDATASTPSSKLDLPSAKDFPSNTDLKKDDEDYFASLLASTQVHPVATREGETVYSSALDVLQVQALKNASKLWIFDDALEVGLGKKAIEWAEKLISNDEDVDSIADVIPLQARQGAGTILSGFLATPPSASHNAEQASLHVIFTTTTSLPGLIPALNAIPASASASARLLVHVATTAIDADSLVFKDDSASVLTQIPTIDTGKFDICLSSTAQQIARVGAAQFPAGSKSVVHFFESTFAAREVQDIQYPSFVSRDQDVGFEKVSSSKGDAKATLIVPAGGLAASTLLSSKIATEAADVIVLTAWSADHAQALGHELSQVDAKTPIYLVNDSSNSVSQLRAHVLSALYSTCSTSSKVLPALKSLVVRAEKDIVSQIPEIANASASAVDSAATAASSKNIAFYSSASHVVPELLVHLFLSSPTLTTRLSQYGSSAAPGVQSILSLAPKGNVTSTLPSAPLDVVWVTEAQILKTTDVISQLNNNGLLVLVLPWTEDEVASKLSPSEIETIKNKNIRVFVLPPASTPYVEQIAFLLLYTSQQMLSSGVRKVLEAFYDGNLPREAIEEAQAGLTEISTAEWAAPASNEKEDAKEKEIKKATWEWDALPGQAGIIDLGEQGRPERGDWNLAARKFLFRQAFQLPSLDDGNEVNLDEDKGVHAVQALRPSIEDKTYLVTVTENRRLTPTTYDRNVFHIAFDTTGTGLEYAVGEALGVHGWNDDEEVLDFIKWYGLDGDALVSFPSPHDGGKSYETRTVFQLLQQNLDLFGKPSKSFYASLATLAKSRDDQRTLRFIAAPEGSALFKKMSEVETVTFADVLKQFKTARPSIEELIGLIPEIKPRHYSIASSQKFVGNLVELLVVTVDWTTPSGSPRYGQCTRYLSRLPVGAKVTVSIKPSVMKLPPLDTQPIIMAGLGTGAAPFRAFIQHRAWQKAQGIEVGPLLYYFGSRYRSQEYLYGEEIEAYMASGIITHAGLAFSRDGREKVYIQHKMTQDKKMLADMLNAQGPDAAYFYLCGPTWPVPDVYEALVSSLVEEGGKERKDAEAYIEELKEDERYVLEVY